MKVVATISVNVKVKESDHPNEVHEKVVEKLANVCEGWLEGEMSPKITINYTMDKDDVESIRDLLN
jgi:hypothetical protein